MATAFLPFEIRLTLADSPFTNSCAIKRLFVDSVFILAMAFSSSVSSFTRLYSAAACAISGFENNWIR